MIHKKMKKSIIDNKLPTRFRKPITLPGKNRWKQQFTKKKFNESLRKFYEENQKIR